jgi:hypothetical protein
MPSTPCIVDESLASRLHTIPKENSETARKQIRSKTIQSHCASSKTRKIRCHAKATKIQPSPETILTGFETERCGNQPEA